LAGLGAPMQVATSELQSSGYLDGATRRRRTADKRKAPPLYDAISRVAPPFVVSNSSPLMNSSMR
jgi:hypothetical protein